VTFERADAAQPPASELLEAMVSELEPLYGRIDVPQAPSATPADFAPPGGSFLVGYEDGEPVCIGGIKRLDDDACEIKRMYRAAGYQPTVNFNANPFASFWGQKRL
jgi:hypothetical protein